ncbi:MAG: PPC domain-containing DNA-binding protein [Oceanidesulfovibrio sp.]
MEYKRFGAKILIRLDPGDEVIESLKKVCRDEKVTMGVLSGIGAIDRAIVGLFDPKEKKYHSNEIKKNLEITALAGNVTTMDGEVYIHAHATMGDIESNAFGGHLNEADVSCTAEIIIDVFEGQVDREKSEKIGLNLLKF